MVYDWGPVTTGPYTKTVSQTLFKNLSNLSCAHCSATFTDSETETNIYCNRVDQIDCYSYVITRHYHFCSFRKSNFSGNIKSSYIELRTVFIVEWSMTSAFFFFKNINLCFNFGMRSY